MLHAILDAFLYKLKDKGFCNILYVSLANCSSCISLEDNEMFGPVKLHKFKIQISGCHSYHSLWKLRQDRLCLKVLLLTEENAQSAGTGESRVCNASIQTASHGSGLAKANRSWVLMSLSSRTGKLDWCRGESQFFLSFSCNENRILQRHILK